MLEKADDWINKLKMEKHPEGGYFKECFRCDDHILHKNLKSTYSNNRNYYSSIFFLLNQNEFSAFHSIVQDEVWYYHTGEPLIIHILNEDDGYKIERLGLDEDCCPQVRVKGGSWFAAELVYKKSFSLVGCMTAPAFDFDDFKLAKNKELVDIFPGHKSLIDRFTIE